MKNNKGFTLIELLIVIVIIAILAGVLIAVLDPARQQNRSRNASVKSAISKIAFAINTTRAGTGRLPDETELDGEVENITVDTDTCGSPNDLECSITFSGVILPDTCGSGSVSSMSRGSGTSECYLGIISTSTSLVDGDFRVIGKKFKLKSSDINEEDMVYVFDSNEGLFECSAGINVESVSSLVSSGCTLVDN